MLNHCVIKAVGNLTGTPIDVRKCRGLWLYRYLQQPTFQTYMRVLRTVGRNSSVSIVTGYGLRRSGGSNPGGGEIFSTFPDRTRCPPSLLYNGYRVFSVGKERPERDADPSSPSSAVVMKE